MGFREPRRSGDYRRISKPQGSSGKRSSCQCSERLTEWGFQMSSKPGNEDSAGTFPVNPDWLVESRIFLCHSARPDLLWYQIEMGTRFGSLVVAQTGLELKLNSCPITLLPENV